MTELIKALAHGAGGGIFDVFSCGDFFAHKVEGASQHGASWRADDGVGFRVDASAEFVAFSSGDFQAFACAVAEFVAVGPPSGGAHVTGGDDFVVFDDDGSVVAADAGGSFADDFSKVEVVVYFVPAFKYFFCFHDMVPLSLFLF